MVDPRRVRQLLDRIAEEERHLRRLARVDEKELLADHDRMHAIKYGFVIAIEAAVDVGRHIIASEALEAPESFAGVFTNLGKAAILTADTTRAMEDAARLRNLLVHQYADVDD
ncbi:MAG TPA: HepT-like ribonuclease domain-containing protein [Acidimicrobiia bacterium]|nr:HepT-like ribonuclease domain-containing protein [Acidimicrobiia bacterium]